MSENNLEKYVNYVQPVVKAINKHHTEFFRLQYFSVSAEDLVVENGLIEFRTKDKHNPEDFTGEIPMVCAQWGEVSGASIVLEISPENRKLLSPEVVDVIKTDQFEYHEEWRKTADQTVYLRMDYEHYEADSGFAPSNEFEDTVEVGNAFDFLTHRLGLSYLTLDRAITDLEWRLDPRLEKLIKKATYSDDE